MLPEQENFERSRGFDSEARRRRHDWDGRPTALQAPGRVAEKAELRNVEQGREESQKKALVQIHAFL